MTTLPVLIFTQNANPGIAETPAARRPASRSPGAARSC